MTAPGTPPSALSDNRRLEAAEAALLDRWPGWHGHRKVDGWPSIQAVARVAVAAVTEPMPEYMATILLRALTWCGDQITQDEREAAWAWVEDRRGNVEEMGT